MDNKNEISSFELGDIERNIDYIDTKEEFVAQHQALIGKKYYSEHQDAAAHYIMSILDRGLGRDNGYTYSEGAMEFLQSSYLSTYMKEIYKTALREDNVDVETLAILDSEKDISEIDAESLKKVTDALDIHYENNSSEKFMTLGSYYQKYLLKLNSPSINEYITKYISKDYLSYYILSSSGLSSNPSYYSGRGVGCYDVTSSKLFNIFTSLYRLNQEAAMNFVKLVSNIKELSATQFIYNFKNFVSNDFKVENLEMSDSNVSLEGLNDQQASLVALASLINMSQDNENQAAVLSNRMKQGLISQVQNYLYELNEPEETDTFKF